MPPSPQDRLLATQASNLTESTLRQLVTSPPSTRTVPPGAARPWLDDLLSKADTYRDAALAILAFPTAAETLIDIRIAPPSRRGVTKRLTSVCEELSIPCKQDAFQTLAKGQKRLDGLDREAFTRLVTWASTTATIAEITAAFHYLAEGVAALARPLPAFPRLRARKLTFANVSVLFDRMLKRPSKGAHEQFILAALLAAVSDATGTFRADTKSLNAADASAGTAGDIQIWLGGVVEEAFEVTGNQWQTKLRQAAAIQDRKALERVHIVAQASAVSAEAIIDGFISAGLDKDLDLSVLDIKHEIRSLTARLRRQSREAALETLYLYLKQRQPDDTLVIEYVQALHECGLVDEDA